MLIYRGTLELLDYVFYATVERGKVYETGAFIHNYAQGETCVYARLVQAPHYVEELTGLVRGSSPHRRQAGPGVAAAVRGLRATGSSARRRPEQPGVEHRLQPEHFVDSLGWWAEQRQDQAIIL